MSIDAASLAMQAHSLSAARQSLDTARRMQTQPAGPADVRQTSEVILTLSAAAQQLIAPAR